VTVDIRRVTSEDLDALVVRDPRPGAQHHERERFAAQERGERAYLVAWKDGEVVGRTTLCWRSSYQPVRDALGDFPEINGLAAWPQGAGIGTLIVAECERIAVEEVGVLRVGLGVGLDNPRARRLYERLGYVDWGGEELTDLWDERDEHGNVLVSHRDPCRYLVHDLTRI